MMKYWFVALIILPCAINNTKLHNIEKKEAQKDCYFIYIVDEYFLSESVKSLRVETDRDGL